MKRWLRFLYCLSLFLISACTSNTPAPYEHRGNIKYDRSNQNATAPRMPDPEESSASTLSSDQTDGMIKEEELMPLQGSQETKGQQEERFAIESEKAISEMEEEIRANDAATLERDVDSKLPDLRKYKIKNPLGLVSFTWPVDGDVATSYGKHEGKFNEGINIAAPIGAPVKAACNGKVAYIAKGMDGYGNLIILKHDNDIMTAYAHLGDIFVERGQTVHLGDKIGSVGVAGESGTPQLHFSVRKAKKTVDPEKVLK